MDEGQEPEVDQVEAATVADALTSSSPEAAAIVREHVEDNGEILPTLLLADIARWFCRRIKDASDEERRALGSTLDAIARLHSSADESVQTIVATGFLEAMPYPHEDGREVVELLPASLREELRVMEDADPPR